MILRILWKVCCRIMALLNWKSGVERVQRLGGKQGGSSKRGKYGSFHISTKGDLEGVLSRNRWIDVIKTALLKYCFG